MKVKEATPLAKYIAGKLAELGSEHLRYVTNPYCFAGGVNVGMSKAYQDILNKLHEEQVKTENIDTLEVKDVSLEKALSDLDKDIKEFITTEEFERESETQGHYWIIAKHAFLLGLNYKINNN